jgi:hypothetical protein
VISLIALCVLINGALFGVLVWPNPVMYKELGSLQGKNLSFNELSEFFGDVSREKGAVYGFELLRRAPLPPNIDVHLLGHIIGDILYEQKGPEAITLCTPEFRNACSHTIVVGTLLENGPSSLSKIADICRQAPGGSGAYGMCFHGLGHGVLAYNEYDISKAVAMCATLKDRRGPEYVECVGGMIMEMIAGVHDREAWQAQTKTFYKDSDPLYPCSGSVIPEDVKNMCYTYLTPHFFEVAGADLGMPQPEHFKKAFTYCEPLKGENRRSCFGGFGKEFVVLAQNRDIRAVGMMGERELGKILEWCDLAKPKDGKDNCVIHGLRSLFWGGENDPTASVKYCALAKEKFGTDVCADELFAVVKYYTNDPEGRKAICDKMIGSDLLRCESKLL